MPTLLTLTLGGDEFLTVFFPAFAINLFETSTLNTHKEGDVLIKLHVPTDHKMRRVKNR